MKTTQKIFQSYNLQILQGIMDPSNREVLQTIIKEHGICLN